MLVTLLVSVVTGVAANRSEIARCNATFYKIVFEVGVFVMILKPKLNVSNVRKKGFFFAKRNSCLTTVLTRQWLARGPLALGTSFFMRKNLPTGDGIVL